MKRGSPMAPITLSPSDRSVQLKRLRQLLNWFFVVSMIMTVIAIITAVLSSALMTGISGAVVLCFGILVLIARRLAAHDKVQAAVTTLCTSIFAVIIGSMLITSVSLSTLILGPIIAIAVVLPYVDGRTLRGLIIVAWAITTLTTILSQVIAPFQAADSQASRAMEIGAILLTVPILLLLLWQYHSRLTETLA